MRRAAFALLVCAACSKPVFDAGDNGKTVEVEVGETFHIELGEVADGLKRYAHVAGRSVKQLDVDRDGLARRFAFEAVRKGKTLITVTLVDPGRRTITGVPKRDIEYALNVTVVR